MSGNFPRTGPGSACRLCAIAARRALPALLALLLPAPSSVAAVAECVSPEGRVVFTNTACPEGFTPREGRAPAGPDLSSPALERIGDGTSFLWTAVGAFHAGLVRSWKRGDAEGVERVLGGSFDRFQGIYDRFVLQRDERWLDRIELFLDTGRDVFVVVGAGRLTGRAGLIARLGEMGCEVSQK